MKDHVMLRGTFEISGLSRDAPLFGSWAPDTLRTVTVHDGTCELISSPGGAIEIRILARRCPGPGVCVTIVDKRRVWVRVLRWLKWRGRG